VRVVRKAANDIEKAIFAWPHPPATGRSQRAARIHELIAAVERDNLSVSEVTVRNERAGPIMMSFSPAAARIAFSNVQRLAPWESLAAGGSVTRRIINQPSATDASAVQQQLQDLGRLAFTYP
jgi:hypothetical protein